ncbi:hypothetical protein [Niallia sp. Krafla_26]|uniref:hypothetical protein n=1 Tax=Niallia sp. Krafla_26 TaxID=3064703 RepID=UPI003D168116
MQVNSQLVHQKTVAPDAPLELKQGEVYSVTVKEKVNNNEAILQIRGKDVHVKFTDGVPADQGRFTVMVNGQQDGMVDVKTIATETNKTVSGEMKNLTSLGITDKDSSEVKQAVKMMLDKGIPLTRETAANLKNFIVNGKGSNDQKLETVQALANKKVEPTTVQLRSVHEALHGKPIHEVLTNIAKEIDPNLSFEKSGSAQNDVTLKLNLGLAADEIRPAEGIQKAIKLLQQEPNFTKIIEGLRQQILDLDSNTLQKATELQEKGRELAARQLLANELQKLTVTEPQQTAQSETYEIQAQLQALNLSSKDILVTRISEKLAQSTADFRVLKQEITRNLNQIEHTLLNNARPQVQKVIEATIQKLDHAILKSDMMLFADMKTEKQLLQASTQLADAKKLLAKGNVAEAGKIVSEIKAMMEKVVYKPSEQKIVHYVKGESQFLQSHSLQQQLVTKMMNSIYDTREPSPRQMYEMVRSLGLNHEHEAGQSLAFQKNGQDVQNVKSLLLRMAQGENSGLAQQAEQALSNLTGQQLISKSDGNGSLQSLMFTLPLLLGGKPESLKVFINSKNEDEQVQWENCSLYFLLETKKLGDVGIHLNATDRNLSITIKNNSPQFKEKMEPLAAVTKEKLQEVGYNVTSIQFSSLEGAKTNLENKVHRNTPVFTGKGLNFTI